MEHNAKEMAKIAYHALSEKKAEDIRILDISEISPIADYFLIASAKNQTQLAALKDGVEEKLGRAGYTDCRIEGNAHSTWILMDFTDVIVHLFSEEDRLFYDLERVWRDGSVIEPETLEHA